MEILQARTLGGLPCPLSGILPNPGIEPRYLALWADSLPSEPPGKPKNTGLDSLFLLQGIFPTQELNWCLLHCRQIFHPLSHQGHPPKFIQLVHSRAGICTWVSLAPELVLFIALIWSHFFLVGPYSHFLYLPWCLRKLPDSLPDSSVGKEPTCNVGDTSSIPGLGRSAGEGIGYPLQYSWAFLVAQLVKNPSTVRETWVRSLGGEDTLEKGTATHPSILAWRLAWTIQSMGSQRIGHDWETFLVSKRVIRIWC